MKITRYLKDIHNTKTENQNKKNKISETERKSDNLEERVEGLKISLMPLE